MSENRLNGQVLSYLSLSCGALALVLCLLPLVAGWFFHLLLLSKILAFAAIVLGIIGIVKKQSMTLCLVGIILGVCTYLCPLILDTAYLEKAAEYANDRMSSAMSTYNGFGE